MTRDLVRGTTGRIVSQIARGTTADMTGEVTGAIAGRVNRPVTPAATCHAPDRIPCGTTDEGLRAVTVKTAPQTMYDTTMYETP